MSYSYEENLPNGLRYTETAIDPRTTEPALLGYEGRRSNNPIIHAQLWVEGVETNISYLTVVQYKKRFGAVALPVEGFGGVATPPAHRRKGYIKVIMNRAIERASERANALFLYGIEGMYTKFDFVSCFPKSWMELSVRHGERAVPLEGASTRPMCIEDAETICSLFNEAQSNRPCTSVRAVETYIGPRTPSDWDAGEAGMVLEKNGRTVGYVVYTLENYGTPQPLTVLELVGVDPDAVRALIAHVVEVGLKKRIQTIPFFEIPDSRTGCVLRDLGCDVRLHYSPDGDGMGCICNRAAFVHALKDEFTRRAGGADPEALEALAAGDIYPDNTVLMRLITGYRSWKDAAEEGTDLPPSYSDVVRKWFPGGGSVELPLAYAYRLDSY